MEQLSTAELMHLQGLIHARDRSRRDWEHSAIKAIVEASGGKLL